MICALGILRRTEKAMIRQMCVVKLSERKNKSEFMERLGLEETVVEVVKRSGLRRMGRVLRRKDDL